MRKRRTPRDAVQRRVVLALVVSIGSSAAGCVAVPPPTRTTSATTEGTMQAANLNTRLDSKMLVARLNRAGELEVSGEDQAETDTYFDTKQFRFHAPDGFDTDYAGLANYFKAVRAAFDDRSIRRGVIVAAGNYVACQTTWIEGTFVREFSALSRAR